MLFANPSFPTTGTQKLIKYEAYKELLHYCLEDQGQQLQHRYEAIKYMVATLEGHLEKREKHRKEDKEHYALCQRILDIPEFIQLCRKRETEIQQMNAEVLQATQPTKTFKMK